MWVGESFRSRNWRFLLYYHRRRARAHGIARGPWSWKFPAPGGNQLAAEGVTSSCLSQDVCLSDVSKGRVVRYAAKWANHWENTLRLEVERHIWFYDRRRMEDFGRVENLWQARLPPPSSLPPPLSSLPPLLRLNESLIYLTVHTLFTDLISSNVSLYQVLIGWSDEGEGIGVSLPIHKGIVLWVVGYWDTLMQDPLEVWEGEGLGNRIRNMDELNYLFYHIFILRCIFVLMFSFTSFCSPISSYLPLLPFRFCCPWERGVWSSIYLQRISIVGLSKCRSHFHWCCNTPALVLLVLERLL